MKANIVRNEIVLSVGMIVKNEEKHLDNCLRALKPLLDAIPSELVIVDTGSDDATVEIAKRYTDKIYNFEWVKDFSAARNFGLLKCVGEWFMFVDADEYLDDAGEMIRFFGSNEERKKYGSAFYYQRNYTSAAFDEHTNFYVHRIERRTRTLRFENPIHEVFTERIEPSYYFKTFVHHYGYSALSKDKIERNIEPLLEELKKNPDDIRTLWHIFDAYPNDSAEKAEIAERASKLIKSRNDVYSVGFYFKLAEFDKVNNNINKAFENLNSAINKLGKNNAALIEVYAVMGLMHYDQNQFADAEACLKKYFAYCKGYDSGKLDLSMLPFIYTANIEPDKRGEFRDKLAQSIIKQNRANDAIAVYEETDFAGVDIGDYKKTINMFFEFTDIVNEYEKLSEISDKINASCDSKRIDYLNLELEERYFSGILNETFKPETGMFASFLALSKNYSDVSELTKFFDKYSPLPEGVSDSFYFAIKTNTDLTEYLKQIDSELAETHLAVISKYRSDLPSLAVRYMNNVFFEASIKNLTFGVILFDICSNSSVLDSNEKSEAYKHLSRYSSLLVDRIYNPELLNDTDISALPVTHRIGYYAKKGDEKALNEIFASRSKEETADVLIDNKMKELAYSHAYEHNTDAAIAVYENTDFAGIDIGVFKKIVDMIFDFTNYSIEYDNFTKVCDKIVNTCDTEKTAYLYKKLQDKYYMGKLSKRFKPKGGDFAELLRYVDSAFDLSAFVRFINKFDPLPEGLSEALSIAIKSGIDIADVIEKMNYELLKTHVELVFRNSTSLMAYLLKFSNDEYYLKSIKMLVYGVMIYSEGSKYTDRLTYSARIDYYRKYALYVSLLVSNVYKSEFIEGIDDESLSALPEMHRLGYYVDLAKNSLDKGNRREFSRNLKAAHDSCKNMKTTIENLMVLL